MIAVWMLTATAFSGLLGFAALAAERSLRTCGRAGRWPWLVAFAMAMVWPIVAPIAYRLLSASDAPPMTRGAPEDLPPLLSPVRVLTPSPIVTPRRIDMALLGLWAMSSVVLLARLALACRGIVRVARTATEADIAGVPVLVTPSLGPAVFGLRHPRVYVPRWLDDLDAPLQELVVRHEVEHCRARDPQVTLATALALAIMPWNAAAWWMARRIRLAMELDCDARVLCSTQDTERYARLLLFIAQRQSTMTFATMLAESTSHLSRRISQMHAVPPARPRLRATLFASAAIAALACSTQYGHDLSTAPTVATATVASRQGAVALYYAPEGSTPARPLPGWTPPRYPDSLRLAGVEGEAIVQYVVDSSGQVVSGSMKVVSSTNASFAAAVHAALPSARFAAPTLGGRNVRQLVQQAFYFDIADGTARFQRAPLPVARPTTDASVRSPMLLGAVFTTASR